jgi:elongator complex protein 6
MAHQAERVVQLRGLETGAARDVSGVLRVSRGGAAASWDRRDAVDEVAGRGEEGEYEERGEEEQEGEWLYQVKGDGNLRVWKRGE